MKKSQQLLEKKLVLKKQKTNVVQPKSYYAYSPDKSTIKPLSIGKGLVISEKRKTSIKKEIEAKISSETKIQPNQLKLEKHNVFSSDYYSTNPNSTQSNSNYINTAVSSEKVKKTSIFCVDHDLLMNKFNKKNDKTPLLKTSKMPLNRKAKITKINIEERDKPAILIKTPLTEIINTESITEYLKKHKIFENDDNKEDSFNSSAGSISN